MATAKKRKQREGFGRIRKLPSGRYQAAYLGPDLSLHKAASTFDTLDDAREWIRAERRAIDAGTWRSPATRNAQPAGLTLAQYSITWLEQRLVRGRPLKPRTTALYRSLLDQKILPTFGAVPLRDITTSQVDAWYAVTDPQFPTRQAHAYSLLRTIMATAERRRLIDSNPCDVAGGGTTERKRKIRPATLPELQAVVGELPERYRVMVLLAAWCALRFGELTELRRKDLDGGTIHVRRGVTFVNGQAIVGPPKSDAGVRDVAIPPHLLPAIAEHLNTYCQRGPDGLMFPGAETGRHLTHGTFYKIWDRARRAAGRPDLRFHDLRHTGAVLAAATGATLAELMGRLGHSTVSAAMRYQHAAQGRDAQIAALLSKMATDTGTNTPGQ